MAIWQFTNNNVPTTDPVFDDGLTAMPGDEGFDTTAVEAEATALGATGFNFICGSPTPAA